MDLQLPTLRFSSTLGAGFDLLVDVPAGFNQVVGRDGSADITVPDPAVSRRHARLWRDTDEVWLEDLGSTNGTYVDDTRLTVPYRLRDEDQVRFGDSVATFHDVASAPAPAISTPMPTIVHEAVTKGACSSCGATNPMELWFCARCGHQQRPIDLEPAAAAPKDVLSNPHGLITSHGDIRRQAFRQALRAGNGGQRVAYSEGLAAQTILFRLLTILILVAAIAAVLILLAHHTIHS